MSDQRLDCMEELGSMEERPTKHIDEMMAALSIQFQEFRTEDPTNHASSLKTSKGKEHSRTEFGNSFPKVAKLNFQ